MDIGQDDLIRYLESLEVYCQRKCGELVCLKEKERANTGHRCSFHVMLTMHMRTLGPWRVEVMGRHVPLTAVCVPTVKNPLRNQSTRTKCREALQSGDQTVRKVSMKLVETERPTKRQLESFIFTQKTKLNTGPGNVQGLVDYPFSDEDI